MPYKDRHIKAVFVLAFIFAISLYAPGQQISNYKQLTAWGISPGKREFILLREYSLQGKHEYIGLSPASLVPEIICADSIHVTRTSWSEIEERYSWSPYINALSKVKSSSGLLQNAGYTSFSTSEKGINLTIDLCPSKLPLDRIVFRDLINEMGKTGKPVPVGISITGVWIREHPTDFKWLDSLDRAGIISVVWINHSYNHITNKDSPLNKNFMLTAGTDVNSEVLNTELLLLRNNIVPSVFFRFPGLVSDRKIYDQVLDLGLIPVGSDAWLAKGEWPKNGSIVLIHANGNEPLGVRDFIKLLRLEEPQVKSGKWELYDLRESTIEDFIK